MTKSSRTAAFKAAKLSDSVLEHQSAVLTREATVEGLSLDDDDDDDEKEEEAFEDFT